MEINDGSNVGWLVQNNKAISKMERVYYKRCATGKYISTM
jgi:hypothetical protein